MYMPYAEVELGSGVGQSGSVTQNTVGLTILSTTSLYLVRIEDAIFKYLLLDAMAIMNVNTTTVTANSVLIWIKDNDRFETTNIIANAMDIVSWY